MAYSSAASSSLSSNVALEQYTNVTTEALPVSVVRSVLALPVTSAHSAPNSIEPQLQLSRKLTMYGSAPSLVDESLSTFQPSQNLVAQKKAKSLQSLTKPAPPVRTSSLQSLTSQTEPKCVKNVMVSLSMPQSNLHTLTSQASSCADVRAGEKQQASAPAHQLYQRVETSSSASKKSFYQSLQEVFSFGKSKSKDDFQPTSLPKQKILPISLVEDKAPTYEILSEIVAIPKTAIPKIKYPARGNPNAKTGVASSFPLLQRVALLPDKPKVSVLSLNAASLPEQTSTLSSYLADFLAEEAELIQSVNAFMDEVNSSLFYRISGVETQAKRKQLQQTKLMLRRNIVELQKKIQASEESEDVKMECAKHELTQRLKQLRERLWS